MMRSKLTATLALILGVALLLASTQLAMADTSGPTDMGYQWIDNQIPDPALTFEWLDISESGTRLALSDCDDCTAESVPIGFEFSIYGEPYTRVNINSNGTLQFVDTEDFWGPGRMPTGDFLGPVILPFWSDWDPRSAGEVFSQNVVSWPGSGQGAFVVQWTNVENWDCNRGDRATWQVALLKDDSFVFQYLDTELSDLDCNRGADMTIGIQQAPDGCFVTYSNVFAAVPNRTAIAWSPIVDACTQDPASADTLEPTQPAPSQAADSGTEETTGSLPASGSAPPERAALSTTLSAIVASVLLIAGLSMLIVARRRIWR